jgi:hypothetical protein
MYGGPFTHEMDAIRDERNRASVMGKKPNFAKIFEGVDLSDGAKAVLEDINKPYEFPVGPVVENWKENDKEETPAEGSGEESTPETDKGGTETNTLKEPSTIGEIMDDLNNAGKTS